MWVMYGKTLILNVVYVLEQVTAYQFIFGKFDIWVNARKGDTISRGRVINGL
jgi:hypothetical protein